MNEEKAFTVSQNFKNILRYNLKIKFNCPGISLIPCFGYSFLMIATQLERLSHDWNFKNITERMTFNQIRVGVLLS